jgi:hypothetical protein
MPADGAGPHAIGLSELQNAYSIISLLRRPNSQEGGCGNHAIEIRAERTPAYLLKNISYSACGRHHARTKLGVGAIARADG